MSYSIIRIITFSIPLLVTLGCDKIKFGSGEKIKPKETYSLKISEPSGLALAHNKLWIVSDRKNTVYLTDLKGNKEFSFKIRESDPEGITVVDDSLLVIVLETPREIIKTDFYGNEIVRVSIDVKGSKNSGLEGVTYNSSNGHFYLIKEKDPVLLIETDKNLNEIRRKKIKGFKDLSGISYSPNEDCLWLLSDEDKKIVKYSMDGIILKEYRISVDQPEGIAIDDENKLIYIVSDKEEKLYVYEIE